MNALLIFTWILLAWLCLLIVCIIVSTIMGLIALIINERKWICCQFYICEKIMGICGYELRIDESSDDESSDYESSDYESSDSSSDYDKIETKVPEIIIIIDPNGERKIGIEN